MASFDYDVIVIGSCFGGSVAALRADGAPAGHCGVAPAVAKRAKLGRCQHRLSMGRPPVAVTRIVLVGGSSTTRPRVCSFALNPSGRRPHHFFRSRERMIAGAVAPPRIDLANQELVEAHLHSVWLALLGVKLGRQMIDVLDLETGAYPLLPELQAQLELSASRSEDLLQAFREVIALGGAEIERAGWFSSEWLGQQARSSTAAFNPAFERWRELYRAAIEQRDTARRRIDMPRLARAEREEAKQREREALREIELLLNQGTTSDAEFLGR